MDLKDKIIELDNNEKYVVADLINLSNKMILVLGKLDEENITEILFAEFTNGKVKKIINQEFVEELKNVYKLNSK